MIKQLTAAGFAISAVIPSIAHSHGYAVYPAARQHICHEQGGLWGDGSTIPNQACRAAYQESGEGAFNNKNGYAALVVDHENPEAVKAVIKDGELCHASIASYSGTGVASENWQRTELVSGDTINFQYRATAVHNPSYWEVYISKPGYNPANSRLTWDDVELFATQGNVEPVKINGEDHYQFDIKLPEGRDGEEVTIFSRWQRVDPAGEGFYNCSDVKFVGEAEVPEWEEIAQYVTSGFEAEVDRAVLFRIFDEKGSEVVAESFPIDSSNVDQSVWTYQLAEKINSTYSHTAIVGVKQQNGEVEYDESNLFFNKVYTKNPDYRYSLDIRDIEVPPPAEVTVTGVESTYYLSEGETTITPTVSTEGHNVLVNVKVIRADGTQTWLNSAILHGKPVELPVKAHVEGMHTLEVTANYNQEPEHHVVYSEQFEVKAEGSAEYDYVYPDGIGHYVEGETVVLGSDGHTYSCREYPYGAWCNIDAPAYVPGEGEAWEDAWSRN